MFTSHGNRTSSVLLGITLLLVGCFAMVPTVEAHQGPPFPIVMEHPLGDYVVSVWTDPDIGEAQFFVIIETPSGDQPSEAPTVSMWTEPVNKRLERASYEAHRQDLRNRMQFEAKPHFDIQDMWTVGFEITPPGGTTLELTSEVESTPPGLGPWDLAIYLFPFLLFGGLWMMSLVRRRRIAALAAREAAPVEVRQVLEPGQFAEPE